MKKNIKHRILHRANYYHIGLIRKTHKYSGHLILDIKEDYISDLKLAKFIFIEIDGCKIPFEIEELSIEKKIITKLTDVNTDTESHFVLQKHIFLIEDDVDEKIDLTNTKKLEILVGYQLIDVSTNSVYIIQDIEQFPMQTMATIIVNGNKKLVPLNENYIKSINEVDKSIEVELPEGLLNL